VSFPNSAATHDHPTWAQTMRMSSFGAGLGEAIPCRERAGVEDGVIASRTAVMEVAGR
jgi:hypothetical protein